LRLIVSRSAVRGGAYGRGLVLGVLLSVVLFAGAAGAQTPEIETKQAQADEVQARIQATLEDVAEAQAAYDASQAELSRLEDEVAANRREARKTEKELEAAQAKLSERAVGSYKSGGVMYLDVLLSVRSFSDLAGKGQFVWQVLKQDRDAVERISGIKEDLAAQRRELEEQREEQADVSARMREERAAIDARLAEQRAAYDSLSAEVQRLVQEEQARQAAERRAIAEAEAQKVAEQRAAAEQDAAARAAREQMSQLSASEQAQAQAEQQAVAEAEARAERQRLAVEAAEAEERAAEAQEAAERERLAAEAKRARQAAKEQAAAEAAARAEQERLVAEARQAAEQAQQQAPPTTEPAAADQYAPEDGSTADDQYAAEDGTTAESGAADQYAAEDGTAAEEQYDASAGASPEAPAATSSDPRVQAILENPNINLSTVAQQDLAAGIVDPMVLDVVEFAASSHTISISVFATGHPYGPTLDALGYAGYPNAHYFGRAVDIYEVDGAAVTSSNAAAQQLAQAIYDNFAPAELGSPWTFGEGSFADGLHQDHIHVGWAYGSDGGL
jgi:peptidoglycan hydrolase CwlO-like protein